MISSGSYELSTFSTSVKSEIKRLDAQIDLFWSNEHSLYQKWGFKENSHVIDLGCGTGYLIQKLSQQFPDAKYFGVEQDPNLFDIACERLQNCPAVIEINHASIEQYTQTDHDFDFAIMRLVLEHIPDAAGILRLIRSILKPNGKIIVIDNDFDYHLHTFPSIDELDILYNAYKNSRIADGGDPCIGRKLPLLLHGAGFDNIQFDVIHSHNFLTGDAIFLTAEGAGIPAQLTKSGFLAEDCFDKIITKWRDMLSTEGHILYRQIFAASGTLSSFNTTDRCGAAAVCLKSNDIRNSGQNTDYTGFVSRLVSDALKIPIDTFDIGLPLIDAGLDSVEALNIQCEIKNMYDIIIKISDILGGNSTLDIINMISTRMNNCENSMDQNTTTPTDKRDDGDL